MVAPLTLDQLVGVRVPIPQNYSLLLQTGGFFMRRETLLPGNCGENEKSIIVYSDILKQDLKRQ